MDIKYADLSLDCIEFKDRLGTIRISYGCSLKGRDEFFSRLESIHKCLAESPPNQSIESLYSTDEYFAHCCDRCLLLNNIDPDWINADLLTALLLGYEGGMGLLVRVNSQKVESRKSKGESGEPATTEEVIAALWAHTNDLHAALSLATDRPWKEVVGVMEARAKNNSQFALRDGSSFAGNEFRQPDPSIRNSQLEEESKGRPQPRPQMPKQVKQTPHDSKKSSMAELFQVMEKANNKS